MDIGCGNTDTCSIGPNGKSMCHGFDTTIRGGQRSCLSSLSLFFFSSDSVQRMEQGRMMEYSRLRILDDIDTDFVDVRNR